MLLVGDVSPVVDCLKQLAANATHFHIDDTGNRILTETSVEKPHRQGQGMRQRTGIYSSCLIATLTTEQQVVLFKTNIGHSGEWIDEILLERRVGLPRPMVMSDALSSNTPQSALTNTSLCNTLVRNRCAVANNPEHRTSSLTFG